MRGKRTGKRTGCRVLRWVMLATLAATTGNLSAARVGKFCFRGQPEDLDGRTIEISDTMVAMSEIIFSRSSRDTTIITTETPSIFLVIDNSGSMQTSPGNDRSGRRFAIASAYIDSVQAKYPGGEAGLAVFGTHLYFDPNDRSYFTRCSTQAEGAYVPLLKFDSIYTAYGNQNGYQILKSILTVSTYDTGADQYVNLTYQPTDTVLQGLGCNITAGFDAAKSAMMIAKAGRCGRYVIFFSDGEANAPGGDATWYFRDSVRDVPTTFSVFFPGSATLQNSWGLRNIDTMTRNIWVNGYDTTTAPDSGCQTRSAYWAGNSVALPTILIAQVWQVIVTSYMTLPGGISIGGATPVYRIGDSAYIFMSMFPLIGQITPVSVDLTYNLYRDNRYVGSTRLDIDYNVSTQAHTGGAWSPVRDSFDVKTWDRDLSFRYRNNPIQYIADTMDSVELCFTFDSGTAKYGYDNVSIDLYNSIVPIDHQRIPLAWVSNRSYSAKFKRQVSGAANIDEQPPVLQYRGNNDTIIAVFRNRENITPKVPLPLDTLRVALPLSAPSGISYDYKVKQHVGETWSVFSANGRIKVHFPDNSAHAIKIFSLAGHRVDSRLTNESDVLFRLPRGAYIVTAKTAPRGPCRAKKIFNIK